MVLLQIKNENIALFVVVFAFFIDIFSFGLVIPIIPDLIDVLNTAPYGGDGIVLGWIVSIFSLSQLLAAPVWGKVSDKIGRKPIILIGLFGSTVSFSLLIFFLTVPGVFISRLLQGIFTGATLPTVRAYIADVSSPEDVTDRYGMLGAAYGLGFALGPSVGGLSTKLAIGSINYIVMPMITAAILTFLNFIAAVIFVRESLSDQPSGEQSEIDRNGVYMEIIRVPQMIILFTLFAMMNVITSGFEALFPLIINEKYSELTPLFIGSVFLIIGLIVGIVQIVLVGQVSRIIGEERVIIMGFTLFALGTFFLYNISNVKFTIFGGGIIAIGLGFSFPSLLSATTKRLSDDTQGIGAGLNESIGGLGRVLGPLIAGYLFAFTSLTNTFLIIGGTLVIIVILSISRLGNVKSI